MARLPVSNGFTMAVRSSAPAACLLIISLAGCGARGPSPLLLAQVGVANEQRQAGCYACLVEALAIFERAAADPRAPATTRRAAFETSVLLAARAKELGLPASGWLQRAQDLAKGLQPDATALPPERYLAALAVLVGETAGLDPEMRQQRTRRTAIVDGKPVLRPERVALDGAPAAQ